VGRLVIRRGPGAVATPGVPGVDVATLRTGAAAFFVAPELVTAPGLELVTAPELELVTAPELDAATAFLATAPAAGAAAADSDFAGSLLAAAGSSGWTGRRKPSASAFRRTRSACASSMEDEWLLTPIPRDRASSRPSLLVRPSSLASS
jgi:hypothetical protein